MANTPFLNLVKPTDTDQALITDINNNSDKIDTGVSTLSEQIGSLNYYDQIGYFDSLSALTTVLNTEIGNMQAGESRKGRVSCTGSFGLFYNNVSYFLELKKSSANYSSCIFHVIGGGVIILGILASGSWSFEQLATVNQIVFDIKQSSSKLSLAAGARGTIQINIAKTGYTPIGIITVYAGDTDVFSLNEFWIESNNANVVMTNFFTELRESYITVKVLYIKN